MATDSSLTFVFFPPSPWSERARWALDHSGINYNTMIYTPMISTPRVRWMTGNFTSRLTVPVAIHDDTVLRDSFSIARYANAHRQAGLIDLFPEEKLKAIQTWNALSEHLLSCLRLRALPRMQNHHQLKINNLPSFIPDAIKPYLTPLSGLTLRQLEKKYRLENTDLEQDIDAGLHSLREGLKQGAGDYLLEEFSYADITMAAVLQSIFPCEKKYIPLDDATSECWTDLDLKNNFEDLITWRDNLYQKHRL